MPCQSFSTSDGTVRGIICSRSSRSGGNCVGCGGRGDLLCDFPSSKASGTCDANLCSQCALHFDWREMPSGDDGKLSLQDNYDFCPTHHPFVFEQNRRLIFVVSARGVHEGELIDRRTPLGNPFRLEDGDTPQLRAGVIERYRRHLWVEMGKAGSAVSQELARLQSLWLRDGMLVLRCWCTPRACHGQVIARALCWRLQVETR